MSSDNIIKAMVGKLPVVYKGMQFSRIEEYVLKFDDKGKQIRSAGLVDAQNRLVRVPIDMVELASG